MIFYWTKNELIGSRLIQWGLDSDCSHFAICFGSGDNSIVVESRLNTGVRPIFKSTFLKKNIIVHTLNLKIPTADEKGLMERVIKNVAGRDYDWKGILFWGIRVLLNKLFFMPLPETNMWADKQEIYCTEVLSALRPYLEEKMSIDMKVLDSQLVSPHGAYELLSGSNNFKKMRY